MSSGDTKTTAEFKLEGRSVGHFYQGSEEHALQNTITSGLAMVTDSVAGFSWNIPADQTGGEYITPP